MEYICDIGISYDTIVRRSHVREKIVRCKDCEFSKTDDDNVWCDYFLDMVEPNGFCKWGKKQ